MSEPDFTKSEPLQCDKHPAVPGNAAGANGAGSPGAPQFLHFDDGKAAGAFRTIGEVARALGIRAHVLRYWEEQFPMLRPVKRSGGRRYYRHEDVLLVETIDRLVHREGYTLRGARQKLEDDGRKGKRPAPATAPQVSPPPAPQSPISASDLGADLGADLGKAGLLGQLSAIHDTLTKALDI